MTENLNKRKILFLCTGNSCRSQMAEGWARHIHGNVLEAFSTGTRPPKLDPLAIRVMKECGVDISHQRSKAMSTLGGLSFDWVITVCGHANETCPAISGKARRFHAVLDDSPMLAKRAKTEEEKLYHYRRVRDEIRSFIETLPERLEQDSQR